MKKLLLILCTLSVLTANIQLAAANAVDYTENNGIPYVITDDSFSGTVKDAENPDLKALASSLGADTDYLNIKNYSISDGNNDNALLNKSFIDFLNNGNNVTRTLSASNKFKEILLAGSCYGISILETLAHNGLISPSDIQAGAEKMTDIVNDDNVEKILCDYCSSQLLTAHDLYKCWANCCLSEEQKVSRLIEDAENAMKNNKYFVICLFTESFAHAVTGIGCADGNWTFNGINYNKCILTLDSNVVDESGSQGAFAERLCLYINTETNQACIPAYVGDISTEGGLYFYSIADDNLLNSTGTINQTKEYDTGLSSVNKIRLGNYGDYYTMTITYPDGSTKTFQHDDIPLEMADVMGTYVFGSEGINYHFEERTPDELKEIDDVKMSGLFLIEKTNEKMYIESRVENKALDYDFDISDDGMKYNNLDDVERGIFMQVRFNEGYYNYSPHYFYNFSTYVNANSDAYMEVTDDGVIIGGNNGLHCTIDCEDAIFDEEGKVIFDEENEQYSPTKVVLYDKFVIADNVMITFNEENNIILMADPDKDGVYDTPVEKGDANSDGKIDASDASEVLAGYAAASSGQTTYINENIADYNGDGIIDASDASAVLAHYADISSGKIN